MSHDTQNGYLKTRVILYKGDSLLGVSPWTDAQCPIQQPWICSTELQGTVIMRTGTQQKQCQFSLAHLVSTSPVSQ